MNDTIKTILKALLDNAKDHARYFNGNGVEMRMFIQNRYPGGSVSGVVLGNVSGGCFIADDIQMGKQPHGTPYWLPSIDVEITALFNEPEEETPEQFGDEPAIGLPPTPARTAVANPSR